jgi:hypothetical protein
MELSTTNAVIATTCLFFFMLMGLEIGRRFGLRRLIVDPEGSHKGTGAVEGAVFGLLGLMMALTFTGAASRFDARRNLIVEETTTVCAAYRRLDLLAEADREPMRKKLREYVDMRIELFSQDNPDYKAYGKKEKEAQEEIWTMARAATAKPECENTGTLILTGIGDVFDIGSRRKFSARMHVPGVILALLFGLAAFSSVLAGYAMATSATRKTLHMFAFATILSVTIFVILDLEYPRSGIISLDEMDSTMAKAREKMKE